MPTLTTASIQIPFLTDLDERARVKGSRDPLGYMSIWGAFGRKVVGNLTSQTVSARGFTTLLLGHWFAEQVQERYGVEAASTLDVFLRFEQLAGYCRLLINSERSEFRGIRRANARLERGTRVTLGTTPEYQILSNQRMYGLWGLYSVASRVSGMLEAEPVLTPRARGFVEAVYLPRMRRAGSDLVERLIRLLAEDETRVDLRGRDERVAQLVARLHEPAFSQEEREFYHDRLVLGGDDGTTRGLQPKLARQVQRLPADMIFDMIELRQVLATAEAETEHRLYEELERIRRLECILAPTTYVFGFTLTRDRKPIDAIADEVRTSWKRAAPRIEAAQVEALRASLLDATRDERMTERLIAMGRALAAGSHGDLVALVLDQNAGVMQARGGSAPWADVEGGKLKVRLRDETGDLPTADALPDLWRHPYFIDPLKSIQNQLAGVS